MHLFLCVLFEAACMMSTLSLVKKILPWSWKYLDSEYMNERSIYICAGGRRYITKISSGKFSKLALKEMLNHFDRN